MARQRPHGTGSLFKRTPRGPWLAAWYDATGKRRVQSTRTTDRAAAERILSKHVAGAALRRDGVIDAAKDRFSIEARKPLHVHISDYVAHCRHTGQDARHVDQKESHLERLRNATGVARLPELTADALERHLQGLRVRGLSARTVNFARQIAVAFISWCVKTGRAESNPLAVVPKLDESRDRRRIRRPLTDDELARLLAVADERGRKAWYLAAALAGLRKDDLQRRTWADVDFDGGTITIAHGKAKRTDVVPMHPQLADVLQARRDENPAVPTARVFPTTVTNLTMVKDFLRAGLAHEVVVTDDNGEPVMIGKGKRRRAKTEIVVADDEGRVIDLHAMRTTLGTNLARAGVTPQIAQRIMRHADYRTTMRHYTVLGLTDTAAAIGRLPEIRGRESEAVRATGTDDLAASKKRQQLCEQLGRETVRNHAKRCQLGGTRDDKADVSETPIFVGSNDSVRQDATRCEKAGDATRTRNIQLGRLMLYQLSYARDGMASRCGTP